MTYGELIDKLRGDLDDFAAELPDNLGVNLDDEIEDPEEAIGEFCEFVSNRSR